MPSANISCYDKNWEHNRSLKKEECVCADFLGNTVVIVFRGLGSLRSVDKENGRPSGGRRDRSGVGPALLRWPRQAWNGSGKIQETGTEEPLGAGSPSSPGGRGVRTCRNGKPSPGLHVEVKDYRLPWCPNKTTPLTVTTVSHKIINVSGSEGPGRASSPTQGQNGFIPQAETSADMPRL